MQKLFSGTAWITIIAAGLAVAGCGYTPEQRAASGAAIGAGTGALVSSAAGARPGGVIASSLLGAGAGAIIGASTAPPPPAYPPYPPAGGVAPVYVAGHPPCRVWDEDIYGRRYCRVPYVYDGPERY